MRLRYVARRLLFALLLVVLVSSGALVLARLAPGDYASDLLGVGANPTEVANLRARLGLDRPILAQYADWLGRAIRFDFGRSLIYDRPVAELIRQRAANTAILAAATLALATLAGISLGLVTGSQRRGLLPGLIRAASIVSLSMPPLLTSLVLVLIAARTGWFPIGGMTSVGVADAGWSAWMRDVLWHLPLPAIALALPIAAMFERLQSQAIAETLDEPYILAAIARGVSPRRVLWRHAFRNAVRPVAALYGLIVGALLSGSFVVEIVTAWPGLGRLMYDALRARDIYLVAGCAAAGAAFLAIGSLVSDLALAAADPRIREA